MAGLADSDRDHTLFCLKEYNFYFLEQVPVICDTGQGSMWNTARIPARYLELGHKEILYVSMVDVECVYAWDGGLS